MMCNDNTKSCEFMKEYLLELMVWGIMIWDGMNAINTRKNYILSYWSFESGAIAKDFEIR